MVNDFLIVDDSPTVRLSVRKMLVREGAAEEYIEEAETGEEALELYEQNQPEIVLLDINLPGLEGHEVAEKMFEISPDARVVVITGSTEDDERVRDTIRKGAFEIITKPIRQSDIADLMRLLADESEGVDRIQ